MKKLLSIILLIVICSSAFAQPFKTIKELSFKKAYIDSLLYIKFLQGTSTGYSIVVYDSASQTLRQVPASTFSTGCFDSAIIQATDYHLPFNGNSLYYLGGDSTLHLLPVAGNYHLPFNNDATYYLAGDSALHKLNSAALLDSTLFPVYVDSTTQAYQQILVAGRDGKISSDSMFRYNFAQNKVVINAKTSAKFGAAIKLYVNGGAVFNGIIAREGGKANQFLKADGSLDTNHYVKSVSVNGTTFNVDTTTGNVDLGTISSGSGGSVTSVGLTSTDFDITGSPITSAGTFTANLKTVNSNIGTFNNVTVNAKGQVLAASNVGYLTSYTETDPIYSSLGVSLAGQQTLTGVKTLPASTVSNPSIVIQSGSAYTGTTTGATWVNSNHIWTYLNGAAQQLDNQASLGNVILNQTSLQSSANFNIDGNGTMGSLTFNAPLASGSINDSLVSINTATGQVRKLSNALVFQRNKTPMGGTTGGTFISQISLTDSIAFGGSFFRNRVINFGSSAYFGNIAEFGSQITGVGVINMQNFGTQTATFHNLSTYLGNTSGTAAALKVTANVPAAGALTSGTAISIWGVFNGYDRGLATAGTLVGVRGEVSFVSNTAVTATGVEARVGNLSAASNTITNGYGIHALTPLYQTGATSTLFANYTGIIGDSIPTAAVSSGTPYSIHLKGNNSITRFEQIRIELPNLQSYASNAAAITGGLIVGELYRQGDFVAVVH